MSSIDFDMIKKVVKRCVDVKLKPRLLKHLNTAQEVVNISKLEVNLVDEGIIMLEYQTERVPLIVGTANQVLRRMQQLSFQIFQDLSRQDVLDMRRRRGQARKGTDPGIEIFIKEKLCLRTYYSAEIPYKNTELTKEEFCDIMSEGETLSFISWYTMRNKIIIPDNIHEFWTDEKFHTERSTFFKKLMDCEWRFFYTDSSKVIPRQYVAIPAELNKLVVMNCSHWKEVVPPLPVEDMEVDEEPKKKKKRKKTYPVKQTARIGRGGKKARRAIEEDDEEVKAESSADEEEHEDDDDQKSDEEEQEDDNDEKEADEHDVEVVEIQDGSDDDNDDEEDAGEEEQEDEEDENMKVQDSSDEEDEEEDEDDEEEAED